MDRRLLVKQRLFPSSLISLWVHGSLLGFLWLPSFRLWDDMEDASEGTQAGVAVIAGQAAVANLPPLDPENVTPVTITIEDPATAVAAPTTLPPTAPVTPTTNRTGRPSTSETPATPDTQVEEGEGTGTFHAGGEEGKGPDTSGKKKCEPKEGITKTGDGSWTVNHTLIDYYATHVAELDRQGGFDTHYDDNHKPDGLKIGLSRCSVIKQVGLRNGDIVHTVNGIHVNSFVQALAAWFKLRDQTKIEMVLTRKGELKTLHFEILK